MPEGNENLYPVRDTGNLLLTDDAHNSGASAGSAW